MAETFNTSPTKNRHIRCPQCGGWWDQQADKNCPGCNLLDVGTPIKSETPRMLAKAVACHEVYNFNLHAKVVLFSDACALELELAAKTRECEELREQLRQADALNAAHSIL